MADLPCTDPGPRPPSGYRLLRTLGQGGDGWVSLAIQESVGREVAVKTLYAATPDTLARFRREGQALSRLTSEHIVRVFDLHEEGGRVSLVMEYVPGGSLAERMLRAPALSLEERLTILRDVAAALSCAHRAGVVHRDVKPANVLLDGYGRAKLSDFGIARLTGAAAAFRTQDGSVSATARYAAPEQLSRPDQEAPALDAYSFAVLALDLLVGQAAPLPVGIPAAVAAALRDAQSDVASLRPAPETLVGLLRDVPGAAWTTLPQPSAESAGRRVDSTVRQAGREDERVLPVGRPGVAAVPAVGWVEPPVYRPRRIPSPAVVGVLAGVLIAVVVALLWG